MVLQQLAIGSILIFTLSFLYNVLFHPLRNFPGPWYVTCSRLWFGSKVFQGTLPYSIKKLHDRYGSVVRIAPNELSYVDPQAWQEIYGRNARTAPDGSTKHITFKKDPEFYAGMFENANALLDSEGDEHRDQKKVIAAAMSRRANLAQEDIMLESASCLIANLQLPASRDIAFDIQPFIQNNLLDTSGKLICGQDLKATETYRYNLHPAVSSLDRAMTVGFQYLQVRRFASLVLEPLEKVLQKFLVGSGLLKRINFPDKLLEKRLKDGNKRSDYVSQMLPHFDHEEMTKNVALLFLGNVETSSSLLSSTLYFLLTNPLALSTVQREIRSHFSKINDITIEGTEDLNFLKSCISESLRLYPPIFGPLPRLVSSGGATICGQHIPENTVVTISHWAAFHYERNFVNAEQFRPDRWLGDQKDEGAKGFHPFGFGPRICVAKDFALINARLTLSHLLWQYDYELDERSLATEWARPAAHWFPARRPLFVKIRARG